ncbi:DUF6380 family protein [Streptomyces jeddahensis]|uniref:Uncharacterized protein n=1 Tax=Streptomyces jeddahensis TaxID=1716141 RepID=A0A177HNL4_9ACTN|nr:hypothetical protein STSP_41830 [Streptomyces jeddahensis]
MNLHGRRVTTRGKRCATLRLGVASLTAAAPRAIVERFADIERWAGGEGTR